MSIEISNRKASYDYKIEETFVCGIELIGSEVKSFRMRGGDISGCFCEVGTHLNMVGSNIIPMTEKGYGKFEPTRTRKLLVTKKEKEFIRTKIQEKGYACIPLKMYFNEKGTIKVLIGIGKGKRNVDRRETIKARDAEREIRKELKN